MSCAGPRAAEQLRMSKLKALIATLVLGSSSIAMAQPSFRDTSSSYDRSERFDRSDRFGRDQRIDRDRRWDRDEQTQPQFGGPRVYRTSWVSLAEPMQLSHRRDAIDVNQRGTFTQLRLQTAAGTSFIQRVIVHFHDGGRQVVEINRTVDPTHRMLQFLLDGNNRRVDGISIVGRSQRGAAIQVFGI